MGWFEVINTGLNLASTAANISVASSVGKMQQQNARAEQVAIARGEMLDLVDRVSRRMKKLHSYMANNPKAAIVLCEFYDRSLKAMGLSPSKLNPEDRPILRDLNEKFDENIEQAKSKLPDEGIQQAYDCLEAIGELPDLEAAINAKEILIKNTAAADEAEKYLRSIDEEWQTINKPAGKAKNLRVVGIILLVLAGLATCTIVPFIVMLPLAGINAMSQNFLEGAFTFGIGVILILVYIASIVSGIVLIMKGKIPNGDRYQTLLNNRNNALRIAQARNSAVKVEARFASSSLEELYDLRSRIEGRISSVLGKMSDFNKLLLLDD
jgi:hypothetical protein